MLPSEQEIIGTICDIVKNIMKDWGLDAEVDDGTLLIQDLGFTSMDIIDLIATLETRYQRKLPYESLVTFADGSYRSELAVKDLAEFIQKNFDVARPDSIAV
ncbi:MAG: acyl carrier protein [Proteobacteria bacterium]|nr:acyl carrier protein [Pseudomonadota bacterium]